MAIVPININGSTWSRIILKDDKGISKSSALIDIQLFYNPYDPGPQQCEISTCTRCANLQNMVQKKYHKQFYFNALWKLPLKLHICTSERYLSEGKTSVYLAMFYKERFRTVQIPYKYSSHLNLKYPILHVDFNHGLSPFEKHKIRGNLIKPSTISTRNENFSISIPDIVPKYIIITFGRTKILLPNVAKLGPMYIMTQTILNKAFFMITGRNIKNIRTECDGVTVKIRESISFNCSQPTFITTIYQVSEISNVLFLEKYLSCNLTVEIRRKVVTRNCKLAFLSKTTSPDQRTASWIYVDNESVPHYILKDKLKIYRYIYICTAFVGQKLGKVT